MMMEGGGGQGIAATAEAEQGQAGGGYVKETRLG